MRVKRAYQPNASLRGNSLALQQKIGIKTMAQRNLGQLTKKFLESHSFEKYDVKIEPDS